MTATLTVETMSALGEPNRFAIVELLRDGPRSVNGIVTALDLRQPLVSKHLKVLSGAGLVTAQANAQQRIYQLEQQRFRDIERWLDSFADVWAQRMDRLDAHLRKDPA